MSALILWWRCVLSLPPPRAVDEDTDVDRTELVEFVRRRGLAVVATCGQRGARLDWGRLSDYRPESFGTHPLQL